MLSLNKDTSLHNISFTLASEEKCKSFFFYICCAYRHVKTKLSTVWTLKGRDTNVMSLSCSHEGENMIHEDV